MLLLDHWESSYRDFVDGADAHSVSARTSAKMRRQTDGEAASDRLIRGTVCRLCPSAGRARRRISKPIARPRLVAGKTLIRIEAGAAVKAEAATADTAGQIEPEARQPGYPLGNPCPPPSRQAPPVHHGGGTTGNMSSSTRIPTGESSTRWAKTTNATRQVVPRGHDENEMTIDRMAQRVYSLR